MTLQRAEYESAAHGLLSQEANQREDHDYALALHMQQEGQELQAVTRSCVVCGDDTPISELPALCYQNWISSEFDSKGWKRVACPESGCDVLLQHVELQAYATPEDFQKFDALSAREAMNDDPNFRWCRGPNCKSGQIHYGGPSDPIFTCSECGFKVCVVHDGTWHQDETCEEYNYRVNGRKEQDQRSQEQASQRLVEKLTKKCPGKGVIGISRRMMDVII
ncbi:hypothetical protein H2199_005809 [Coniosporium tulheliwenetii]|uniref:Uncharacterized protein n=1 Tax=Coniosporium tulheliwenetii TaxID=3383036 RepID=A0ACC2Z0R7_9PEZI|nr:hypothetical protein H2199_005809 [Cladosporium sp. JES 115]